MEKQIVLEGISKIYGKDDAAVEALSDVNLDFSKGEFIGITGTSGSGKTTLLRIIGLLDSASKGRLLYEGKDMSAESDAALSALRCEKIGYVFQDYHLIPELTARENIMLPQVIAKKKGAKTVDGILKKLQLDSRQTHYPSQMSGGQQQRVAIGRALVNEPELLLCDEPTGNLDQKNSEEVMEILLQINEEMKTTVIIVTHDEKVAASCKRIIHIEDGKIIRA